MHDETPKEVLGIASVCSIMDPAQTPKQCLSYELP